MSVSFLIYFIQDLVNFLLGQIRRLCEGLCAGFIKQFLLNLSFSDRSCGIKKIIEPIVNVIHPLTPIVSSTQCINKKKSAQRATKMSNMPARICSGNSGKINDQKNHRQHPKRNTAIEHGKDPVTGRDHGRSDGDRHDARGGSQGKACTDFQGGNKTYGKKKSDRANNSSINKYRNDLTVSCQVLHDIPKRP